MTAADGITYVRTGRDIFDGGAPYACVGSSIVVQVGLSASISAQVSYFSSTSSQVMYQ